MACATYYEIAYAGVVQRAWIAVFVAGCWSSTSAPPSAPSAPSAPSGGATKPAVQPLQPVASAPPARAPLDGLFQVQPEAMCGGAALPEDYAPPPLAPVAGATLRVLAGDRYRDVKPVVELTTAADGTFMAELPAGRYCIARPRGARPSQASPHHDLACLIANWERCEAVVEVPVKNRVTVDVHEPCSWAVCYHGPPPP